MKSPIELLFSLLNDIRRLNPGVKGLERDKITLECRFENEGLSFLTKTLPTLCDSFVQGLSTGRFTCPAGFKTIRGGTIPRLFSGMFCEIFEPSTGHLREFPDQGILTDLYQVCKLAKKTQLSSDDEALLHERAVSEFYRCDEIARLVEIPDRHDHLIGLVCKLILPTLEEKDVQDAVFRHGPGAVAESMLANQKWSAIISGDRDTGLSAAPEWSSLHEFLAHVTGPQLPGTLDDVRNWRSGSSLPSFQPGGGEAVPTLSPSPGKRPGVSPRAAYQPAAFARLVTVAKDSSSRRTITVEPVVNQYHQQGLSAMLKDSINECSILNRCIALESQGHNQLLALEGSRHDNWATLDLKSASDLLSVKLVKSVFRHHALFLTHIMDCRTSLVKSDLRSISTLGKFAGMGNALTFPLQSICYATVCIASILDYDGARPTIRNVRRAAGLLRVYGDDIIVSTKYAHQCVDWLQQVGLLVNKKKSFLSGNFKESCGVDAFRGVNITPVYLRHHPDQISQSPSVCASFVALSNQLWLKGLYEASNCVRDHVESYLGKRLPLVGRNSGSLGWISRLDASTPHKWCRRTHQLLQRAFVQVPLKRRDRLDGIPALLKCLTTPLLGRDKDHLERTAIRYKTRLAARWVPIRVG